MCFPISKLCLWDQRSITLSLILALHSCYSGSLPTLQKFHPAHQEWSLSPETGGNFEHNWVWPKINKNKINQNKQKYTKVCLLFSHAAICVVHISQDICCLSQSLFHFFPFYCVKKNSWNLFYDSSKYKDSKQFIFWVK